MSGSQNISSRLSSRNGGRVLATNRRMRSNEPQSSPTSTRQQKPIASRKRSNVDYPNTPSKTPTSPLADGKAFDFHHKSSNVPLSTRALRPNGRGDRNGNKLISKKDRSAQNGQRGGGGGDRDSGRDSTSINGSTNGGSSPKSQQFEFRIGMQVGIALGECHLQVQKLETTMVQLTEVSDDITDVIGYLKEQTDERIPPRPRNDDEKNGVSPRTDPFEEILILNDNLNTWKGDATNRMSTLTKTLLKLQRKLEELDDFAQHVREHTSADRSQLEDALKSKATLQGELHSLKRQNNEQQHEINRLKRQLNSSKQDLDERGRKLEEREKALDHDAEIIATQSDELRKESERLLKERDEVRKQKEQWQQMLEEQKDHKLKLEQRELEVRKDYRQLRSLEEKIEQDKEKIAKKKKKIKAREKRFNTLREQMQNGGGGQGMGGQGMSINGSDYAESELTYFSDGDTEIASVNSISDDESTDQQPQKPKGQPKSLLGVPNSYMN